MAPEHVITCPLCNQPGLYLYTIEVNTRSISRGEESATTINDPEIYLTGAVCASHECDNEIGVSQLSDIAAALGYENIASPDFDDLREEFGTELAYWIGDPE